VNWNSGRMLRECLDALAAQTRRPDRVVVVDNGSTDGSADGQAPAHLPVEVLRLGANVGFAAANNRAVASLGTSWVALLNPDAFPEPEWLSSLLRAAESHPEYTLFASRLLRADDPSRLDGAGDVYYPSGLAARRDHGRAVTEGTASADPEEVFAPCAAAALLPVSAFQRHGGFDESYFCYFEDVDLAFRLRLAGHRCLYVPEAVARHVGSASAGAGSDFTLYHGHRNLVWTFFKDMPLGLLLLYLPQHVLLNLVSLAYFAARGRGRTIARAKWDALRGLPRVLRERARVQEARTVGSWAMRRLFRRGLLAPYRERLRDGAR